MAGPRFDPTINLGHIIQLLGGVLAVAAVFFALKGQVDNLDTRVGLVETLQTTQTAEIRQLQAFVPINANNIEHLQALAEAQIQINQSLQEGIGAITGALAVLTERVQNLLTRISFTLPAAPDGETVVTIPAVNEILQGATVP